MTDYTYTAGLDAGALYQELQRIDANMQNLGKQGVSAFNQVEREAQQAGAAIGGVGNQTGNLRQQFGQLGGILQRIGGGTEIGKLGAAIGVVSGGVGALTAKLIEMAAQAVQSFNQVYQQAVQMNQEAESARYLFQNLFGGDTEMAGALVEDLKKLAQQLGISSDAAFKFAQAIAPDSANVGELKQLMTLADRFSDLENRPMEQLIFSFNEMVAGDFVSAKDILNINKEVIKGLKDRQKEYGAVQGLVVGLTEYLEGRGLGASSLDAMAGSAQQTQKSIAGIKSELTSAFGAAPFEAMKESQDILAKFLNDNREPLMEIAYAAGDLVASFTSLGTALKQAFAGDVDLAAAAENFREIVDQINEINIKLGLLWEQVSSIGAEIGGEGWLGSAIDMAMPLDNILATAGAIQDKWMEIGGMIDESGKATNHWAEGAQRITAVMQGNLGVFEAVNMALETANQLMALVKAGWAAIIAGLKPFFEDMGLVLQGLDAAWNKDFSKAAEINNQLAENMKKRGGAFWDQKAATDAMNASLIESVAAMDKAKQKTNEYYDALDARQAGATSGGYSDETALPGGKDPLAEDEETTKARDKLQKATEKAEVTHQRNLLDIQADAQQKYLDMQQDFAEKRMDIELKYQQQIEDINRKFARDIADAEDFSDEERALAQNHRQALIDLDKETSRERQAIEKDYQRQIQAIQRQFEAEAEDAARNQDAIAFLRAQENRDRGLTDAAVDRDQKLQDAATAAQQQRQDLLTAQQQEVADSKAANQEKLADLQQRLAQELEDAQIKYQRDLEAQSLAEQRKTDELALQIDRRVQKELQANQRRLEDLQRTLAKEIELVQAAEAKKAQLRSQSMASTPFSQRQDVVSGRMNLPGLEGISGRALGGGVMAGMPVVVGERGPELFVPPATGQIIPNHRLMYSPAAGGPGGAVTYNQQQLSMSMLDPSQVSPAQRAAMRQEALAILAEL